MRDAEWIITANQRQVLEVQRQRRLPAEQVLTWSALVERCWQRRSTVSKKRWLSPFEQQCLWQRLLQADARFESSQYLALVQSCSEAWYWLHAWCVPLSALKAGSTSNSEWFYPLALAYREACRQNAWVDAHQALEELMSDSGLLAELLPKSLVFYRFWQRPPILERFRQQVRAQGIEVHWLDTVPRESQERWLYSADSAENELSAMVRWVGEQAQTYPRQTFACVVSDLNERRAYLESCFQRYLPPALLTQVHFSLGQTLADYPVIRVLGYIVQVASHATASVATLTYLSHSPFWAHAEAMTQLLSAWRQQQWAQLPPSAWELLAPQALYQWWLSVQRLPCGKALPSEWCHRWQELWRLSAWPMLVLSREEQAVVTRFEALLGDFAALDDFLSMVSLSEAIHHWQQLLQQTIFEPPAAHKPRIYCLGLLEAVGSDFDQLWLSNVVQTRWPKLPCANALIPRVCQENYAIPATTPASKLLAQQALWHELSGCARHMVASFATLNAGEHQQSISYCATWPSLPWQACDALPEVMVTLPEWSAEPQALACAVESVFAPGGVMALQAQANCPFQALARYRLNLRTLPEAVAALTAAERGLLVHKALHLIWQPLATQAALLALTTEERDVLIERVVRGAMRELSLWRRRLLSKTLQRLERQRLQRLLHRWLDLEAQRPAFTIEQVERDAHVVFAAKSWHFRPDRIDRLASGERVVIDYKTGNASVSWQTEPLLEPQLPFYAVLDSQPILGLAIAQVTQKNQKISGLAATSIDCGPLGQLEAASDWSGQITQWYAAIEGLAQQYLAGWAEVKPAKGAATCRSCDLQTVCRVQRTEDRGQKAEAG